jgi:hypothetical protein
MPLFRLCHAAINFGKLGITFPLCQYLVQVGTVPLTL